MRYKFFIVVHVSHSWFLHRRSSRHDTATQLQQAVGHVPRQFLRPHQSVGHARLARTVRVQSRRVLLLPVGGRGAGHNYGRYRNGRRIAMAIFRYYLLFIIIVSLNVSQKHKLYMVQLEYSTLSEHYCRSSMQASKI